MDISPRVLALATAVPRYVLSQTEVVPAASRLFAGMEFGSERFAGIYANAGIDRRYSCVPLEWYSEPHTFKERNDLYIANALDLAAQATLDVLEKAGLPRDSIGGLVTVSSTGIATPSLDALLMERLGLRRDIRRLPIFGLGCAGGVLGLARAAALARSEPGRLFLCIVVELCGLTFRHADRGKSNLIATALFGDGAAAALVQCGAGHGAVIRNWGEHTWPHSLDIMGWNVADDGLGVRFARDIPELVRRDLRATVDRYLVGVGDSFDTIDYIVCHPGGAKVVDALEDAFELGRGALGHTRAILREFGNMSAPTVLFALERAFAADSKGRFLLTSLGPGFSAGFLTLERS
ncbi:MAG: type III polyketide synthase [Alphaproteobacteria bacterium]|nr:type III polyketide synthase [Alphaproteobacteria bacterium]